LLVGCVGRGGLLVVVGLLLLVAQNFGGLVFVYLSVISVLSQFYLSFYLSAISVLSQCFGVAIFGRSAPISLLTHANSQLPHNYPAFIPGSATPLCPLPDELP
jgi:hypothetical protein